MPPHDDPYSPCAVLQAILREHGMQGFLGAVAMLESLDVGMDHHLTGPVSAPSNGPLDAAKWIQGLKLLRDDPSKWFKTTEVDERDLALINATTLPWVNIGQPSFLKHVTHWTVKNDKALRGMIAEVGAGFVGFTEPLVHLPARNWESMMININIKGNIAPGITWGLLSGRPTKTRVLAGPHETCVKHPWDIMILRDFHTNTSNIDQIPAISSRQYDILLMKMCEDMDYPWVVLAVRDSGPLEIMPPCSNNGQCDNSCLGF